MAAQSTVPLGMVIVLAIVAAWILHKLVASKEGHGDVELGVPTVTGDSVIPGSDVYYGRRGPSIEQDPSNPAVDARMRELIWESNHRIAIDDEEEAAAEAAEGGF